MAGHRQVQEAPLSVGSNSHTQNSSLSSAVTLTTPAGANALLIQAFTQNIRYTVDGTTPTASKGFQLAAGSILLIDVGADMTIKVIEETASASIDYQWGDKG